MYHNWTGISHSVQDSLPTKPKWVMEAHMILMLGRSSLDGATNGYSLVLVCPWWMGSAFGNYRICCRLLLLSCMQMQWFQLSGGSSTGTSSHLGPWKPGWTSCLLLVGLKCSLSWPDVQMLRTNCRVRRIAIPSVSFLTRSQKIPTNKQPRILSVNTGLRHKTRHYSTNTVLRTYL